MKENWKEQMKQKLEGHKMSPPAGLWEGISQEMGLESEAATKKSTFVRWYWAVAAVVVALVGFFALYQFDDNEPIVVANNENMTVPSNPVEEKSGEAEIPKETLMADKPSLLSLASNNNNTDVEVSIEETTDETQYEAIVETQQTVSEETKTETHQPKQTYLPDVTESNTTDFQSECSSKWTLGLVGSNGLLLANNSGTQPLHFDNNGNYNGDFNSIEYSNSYKGNNDKNSKTDIVSKHNIPLRLGISLQYQLNNRLALYSGISYTYLKSEISVPLYNNSYDQKLSYLGIPLGISWQIWFTEHMSIYLSGGTMIEKCVSAEVTEGKLDSHPWQWSVNASVGAEYKIIRQLGIYLEPSLGYYFDDGTSIEHYYKEHPLAPSIQFGLRFHLK
jgi:hypothetical protein